MSRGRLIGWDESQEGLENAPTYEGLDEWQEGAVHYWTDYLGDRRVSINGYEVEPDSVT
ncbi:MAG: hypothetical protein M3404_00860 [Actinomycetota bacterium]|nr:hypothetical protein [Actinomycetota bacterium]